MTAVFMTHDEKGNGTIYYRKTAAEVAEIVDEYSKNNEVRLLTYHRDEDTVYYAVN